MKQQKVMIVGIAGASGSGKSLLASTIIKELGTNRVVVISEDNYYKDASHLPLAKRRAINFDHPDSFDYALLNQHLVALQRGESIQVPQYDHTQYIRNQQTKTVGKDKIILLEGILVLAEKSLQQRMDIRIFIDAPLDICLIRRLKRDLIERGRTIESVLRQYEHMVRPMYLQFIEPSKRYADLIVPRGGKNEVAIDMITTKMRELLN